jgi:aconitate hydratase
MSLNSFDTRSSFTVEEKRFVFYNLNRLPKQYNSQRLPFSLKILLENLLRHEDNAAVSKNDIKALLNWSPKMPERDEIAFTPARVILQDFTGVPAVVDLAAMRHAMRQLGGKASKINPLSPVELVIDHSVMVDYYGNNQAYKKNVHAEFARNEERYAFLRWGQTAFENFRVVPPGTGIVHQVNLEYLARVIFHQLESEQMIAYPDTLVGTDSHTTMINGLGVLGWGVGGIEAEAAMLGQPVTMLIPEVIGFKITGQLPEGTTATDLVLTVTEQLRKKNVVGKFVEFYGDGLDHLPLADRATIANMAPEYGATCGIFPIDVETLKFLKLSGREDHQIQLIEAYAKAQGLFRTTGCPDAEYSDVLTLDLSTVVPSIAGPRRPQDRISLTQSKTQFRSLLKENNAALADPKEETKNGINVTLNGHTHTLTHGAIVIAAITSCTNTSNPDVMIAAGLLAKKAQQKGLSSKPWVKTSLAPGSQVVTDYLEKAQLMQPLETLGFNLVGYGCTTCIGNSGPLPETISQTIKEHNISVAAVLSGNRNFEGRIHPLVRYAYLASPPLVVAFALAGTMNIDFYNDPIGQDKDNQPVYLKDLWPSASEIQTTVHQTVKGKMYIERYREVFTGDARWQNLNIPKGEQFDWQKNSTYIKLPPYFEGMQPKPASHFSNITGARILALLGDSVTTDHISPAGDIAENSPAGHYLQTLGVSPQDFNSYGSRRGNHEVMMRGTFANIRLKNQLIPGVEGNWTLHFPSNEKMSIYDAATRYQKENRPLILIAGKEYGTGSSRDWAAKGPRLLGVRIVIAESFERIHRSNLIGMGILPLQFLPQQSAKMLGLTGRETYTFYLEKLSPRNKITIEVTNESSEKKTFSALVRIDTPKEIEYYQHGGILQYVLRKLLN